MVLSAHTLSTNQHFIPVAVSLDTLAFSAASKDEKVKVSVPSLHLNRLGSKFDVFYSGEKSKEAKHRVKSEQKSLLKRCFFFNFVLIFSEKFYVLKFLMF